MLCYRVLCCLFVLIAGIVFFLPFSLSLFNGKNTTKFLWTTIPFLFSTSWLHQISSVLPLFSISWLHQISSVPSFFGEINKHILSFSLHKGFPGGSAGKESACNAGVLGLIPGLGRSPGERKSCPLQYSGLENSMNSLVHGISKSRTWLSDFHFHFFFTLLYTDFKMDT